MAKAASKSTFSFKTTLSPIKSNLLKTAIFLPKEIVKALPAGRVRAKGTFNGVPFDLAPQYKSDGSRFFSVSASLRRSLKIKVGDPVTVTFKLSDPAKVDVPEELAAVLAQDDKAMKVWNGFTFGLQRSLIHYVTAVKNVDSRIKRALEMMEKAKAGKLLSQSVKEKKN
jgi:hypothetical protein